MNSTTVGHRRSPACLLGGEDPRPAVGDVQGILVDAGQRLPQPERGLETGEQVGDVFPDEHPRRHLKGVESQRGRVLVADGDDLELLESLDCLQLPVVVRIRVDRLDHQERDVVVDPELAQQLHHRGRLARARAAREQRVLSQ